MRKKMTWIVCGLLVVAGGYAVWKFTSRTAYESAAYTTTLKDGAFEVREYPDLVLATTPMSRSPNRDDGSFMRLFGYISGKNADERKLSMTVPVFMDSDGSTESGRMGFVVPEKDVARGVPTPANSNVDIKTRAKGRFAVVRFSGIIADKLTAAKETELRTWMEANALTGEAGSEIAGYDPPWLPGALRRNEILIRLTE